MHLQKPAYWKLLSFSRPQVIGISFFSVVVSSVEALCSGRFDTEHFRIFEYPARKISSWILTRYDLVVTHQREEFLSTEGGRTDDVVTDIKKG